MNKFAAIVVATVFALGATAGPASAASSVAAPPSSSWMCTILHIRC